MKVLKKLAVILPSILIVVVLVLLIAITSSIKRNETPSLFGYSVLIVVTDSMEPALKVNDLIVIKPTTKYDVGDIITFYAEISGQTVRITHRIIEIDLDNQMIITQGDRAYADITKRGHPDFVEEVAFEHVIGKMILQSSLIGSLVSVEFLTNKNLIFGLIFGVLLIMIGFQIADILKEKNKIKQEQSDNTKSPQSEE